MLDLLDANYTFVNERLAKHYGIPNIYGPQFRRVTLPAALDMRRGLLGKGALLTVTSNAARTSPVTRGKWFLQTFLGVSRRSRRRTCRRCKERPADTTGNAKAPTMRQTLEAHRRNPTCASCHQIFEPIGLALENFDAVGGWRTLDEGQPIDATARCPTAPRSTASSSLRAVARALLADQFVRVVAEKLLTYALGRGVEYEDMPMVRSIVRDAAAGKLHVLVARAGHRQEPPVPDEHEAGDARGAARRPARETHSCFLTKKHISRRTILRGAGAMLALPLLDAMVPARTALAQTAARAEAALRRPASCRTGWRRATGCPRRRARSRRELPFNWKPLEPFRESDGDPQRPALAVGRTAARRRPAPITGWPRRSCARRSRRRRPAPTSTPARRSTRSSRRRSARENLMPSMQLAVEDPGANSSNCGEGYSCTYTNTISWASPTLAAADGAEPAGGVRADVRRRQHRRAARGAPQARPEHPRFADRQPQAPAQRRQRDRPRAPRRLHRERARDRAPAADRDEGVDGGAREHRRCRSACRRPSTSTSSCSSTCWRWRSRPTSPASARCSSRAT